MYEVYASPKTDEMEPATLLAAFAERREAWEFVAAHLDTEAYEYMLIPRNASRLLVTFTRDGKKVGEWGMDDPTVLPSDHQRVEIDGQLWIVQQHGVRWLAPNHVEIVLSYKANTAYDKRY